MGTILGLKRLVPVEFLRACLGWWLGRHFGQLDPHASPRPVDYVTSACMLIRRKLVEEIGELDGASSSSFEEKDFCLRARHAGWAALFVPDVEVVHYIGGSSKGRPETTIVERGRSPRQFYEKHYGWLSSLGLRGILLLGGLIRLGGRP